MTDIVSILRLVVLTLVIVNAVRSWRSGKNDDRRYQGRGVRSIIIWLFAGPLWLITLFALLQGDVLPIVVALHAAATILLFPWPIISRVLIPAGMTRTAYHLARLADFTWAQDRHGGMLTAAALAARIDPKRLPWLRAHLESADLLGAGGVFATALVADIDGDHARADASPHPSITSTKTSCPPWCAAYAQNAARGACSATPTRAHAHAETPSSPSTAPAQRASASCKHARDATTRQRPLRKRRCTPRGCSLLDDDTLGPARAPSPSCATTRRRQRER